ncbi:MAG: methyltransferase domain-containing protein [bacterium]
MLEKEYKKKKVNKGLKPEKGLIKALKYTQKGIALDIGAGQGRNSIFLANYGFRVEAVDKDNKGLKKCKEYAKKHNLSIKTKAVDIKDFKFKKNKYSIIFSITGIDFLKFSEIKKIIKKK